jgi:pimeloyl-ACP methyl ester carboxylesterase
VNRYTDLATYGTEVAAFIRDRSYRPDGTKMGVIALHGLNGRAWHYVNNNDLVVNELARRKFPVLCPEAGGTATWGNDLTQTKIADAKTAMQDPAGSIRAKPGPVLLWCGSMGTQGGLNYMRANPANVAGVAVGLPAVDLADLHDNAAARGIVDNTSIEAAYGGAAAYAAARAAHNPSENMAAYQPLASKIKLWYSNDDPTVIPAVVTAFAAGTGVTAVNMGNVGGHVFGAAFATAVADFLEAHA